LASPQAVPPGSAKVESTKPPPGTETTPPDPPARAVAEPTRAPEPPPAAAEPAPAAAEPAPARPHAAAEPALKPGAAVMIEQRLEIAGALLAQQATGELGPATRAALARFQAGNGLPPTGEVDEATVRKLDLDPRNILFETEPGALK
jgi:hypothetical protein